MRRYSEPRAVNRSRNRARSDIQPVRTRERCYRGLPKVKNRKRPPSWGPEALSVCQSSNGTVRNHEWSQYKAHIRCGTKKGIDQWKNDIKYSLVRHMKT
jgi:hypothetical protein